MKHLQEENDQITKVRLENCDWFCYSRDLYHLSQDEQQIKQYREETSKMRTQIRELQSRCVGALYLIIPYCLFVGGWGHGWVAA